MQDWNVVVTTREGYYNDARRMLAGLGRIDRTRYYNVLVMHVDDIDRFLAELRERGEKVAQKLGHVVAVTDAFEFDTLEEFEERATRAALAFVPQLAGESFHVRMHRRGHAAELHRTAQEQRLDREVLAALQARGCPGRIDFADPDYILAVEIVDGRAGLSLWSRDERADFPILGLH